MSKDSNPVIGTITFGPGMGDGKAVTMTEYDPNMPGIDIPSIMRTAGWDEGLEAAAKEIEEVFKIHVEHLPDTHCSSFGCADLRELITKIRAMKSKP